MKLSVRYDSKGAFNVTGVTFGPGLNEVGVDDFLALIKSEAGKRHLPNLEIVGEHECRDKLCELDWHKAKELAPYVSPVLGRLWRLVETRKSVKEALA